MSLNWRKGFNRVFVLVAVGWAGYVLFVYPYQKRSEAYNEYEEGLRACAKQMLETPSTFSFDKCAKEEEKIWRIKVETYSLPRISDIRHWPAGLLVVGAIIIVPPAIAYGLFRLGWFVFAWVTRGFRGT